MALFTLYVSHFTLITMQTFLTDKSKLLREVKDYFMIGLGLFIYSLGWSCFMLPYQITMGGVTGISAIVYYATGINMQFTYLTINAILLLFALRILGWKFCVKTIYAVAMLSALLTITQKWFLDDNGQFMQLLGPGQDFMACVLGACCAGIGVGLAFTHNGSTGGMDIVNAIINKFRNISFGRATMISDIIIISSCYFVFHDWRRVMFGFVSLIIMSVALDYYINSTRGSVQFLIFSNKYDEIADYINMKLHRGVTVLDGTGWYSKNPRKVLVVLAKRQDAVNLFRIIHDIDPNAFVSQSNVTGVYGEGFDKIKVK